MAVPATAATTASAVATRNPATPIVPPPPRRARPQGARPELSSNVLHIGLADVADHFLVFATLDPEQRHRAITAFIVERGFSGLDPRDPRQTGVRAGNVGSIRFQDVFVIRRRTALGRRGRLPDRDVGAGQRPLGVAAAGSMGIIGMPGSFVNASARTPRLWERNRTARTGAADDRTDDRVARQPAGCWSASSAG